MTYRHQLLPFQHDSFGLLVRCAIHWPTSRPPHRQPSTDSHLFSDKLRAVHEVVLSVPRSRQASFDFSVLSAHYTDPYSDCRTFAVDAKSMWGHSRSCFVQLANIACSCCTTADMLQWIDTSVGTLVLKMLKELSMTQLNMISVKSTHQYVAPSSPHPPGSPFWSARSSWPSPTDRHTIHANSVSTQPCAA